MNLFKAAVRALLPLINRAYIFPTMRNGNRLIARRAILFDVRFDVRGHNNTVKVADGAVVRGVRFLIRGDNNKIIIGERVRFNRGSVLWLDSGSLLTIGAATTIESAHLAVTEGTTLTIGEDCMFATEIEVRTGDSHSILEGASGRRINRADDVTVGNRTWIGARAIVLKGVTLAPETIVAAGAVVTRGTSSSRTILAGNPARTVREDVVWDRQRL